ncbi:hypothetical protein CXB51_026930 [Gossypium anomalum]|uniref:RNase H type-1 domain-containing protein n=1 Tax=Gossypium anomalum TaxID=47600 RepID=A0A8J5YLF2_9ROSI|nr:hypothetical protein CXB51_026930 [Gossypium anomalum]
MNLSPTRNYTLCGDNQETIIHALHDCSIATKVWERVECFRKYVRRGFALKFELWAILIGLEVARLMNYSKIIVESDCFNSIEMTLENSENIHSMTFIRRIIEAKRQLQ